MASLPLPRTDTQTPRGIPVLFIPENLRGQRHQEVGGTLGPGPAGGRGLRGMASKKGWLFEPVGWACSRTRGRGLSCTGGWAGPRLVRQDSRGLHAPRYPIDLHVGEVAPQGLLLLESLEQCVEVAGSKALEQKRGGELQAQKDNRAT